MLATTTLPLAPYVILMIVIGAAVTWAATRIAPRRAAAQPVDFDLDAERALISHLAATPYDWFRVAAELKEDSFSDPKCAAAFAVIASSASDRLKAHSPTADVITVEDVDSACEAASTDAAAMEALTRDLVAITREFPVKDVPKKNIQPVLFYGSIVYSAADSREQNTDASPIVPNPEGGLMRELVPAPPTRSYITLGIGAIASLVLALALHKSFPSSLSLALASIAGLITIFSGVELSLVDIDTYYLDSPVFIPTVIAAWMATAGAALVMHNPGRLIAGVAVAGAIAIGFEVLARLFALVRGHTQGAGDTWIIILTAGVPAALLGSWRVGLFGMLAGCLTSIVEWSIRRKRGQANAETPIAFGPHLAAGWIFSVSLWLILGAGS